MSIFPDPSVHPGKRLLQLEDVLAENELLRQELRTTREAAEITADLVVKQFEKSEALLTRLQQSTSITETTLRETKGIMENAPVGIAFTRDRKIYRYNGCFGTLFGFPGDSAIGQPGRVLYPSDEAYAEVGRRAAPLLSQNLPFEQEMLLQRQDGSDFWANVKAYVADPRNQASGTIWIVQDRSTFKAAEAEIKNSNEEMAAIFESSTLGIAFIKDRVMIKANSKLEELFGYGQGELCGQPTRCWYPDEESYQAVGDAYNVLAQGYTHRQVMKMQHKDKSLFWARLSGCALSADLSRGSVWTVEDITAEYEATETVLRAKEAAEAAEEKLRNSYAELEEANQRLQKLDQLKSDFLSSVSHELRTPLTSIRGFAHLVEREFSRSFASMAEKDAGLTKKSRRIQENLGIVLKESDRLTRLINDVLDLAKIEAGRVDWRDAPIQPGVLVRDAVNAARGMFDQKPAVELKIDIEDGLPRFVGDADRMLQVLVNVLNNAAKFTDQGVVAVHAFLNPENLIQIDISDSGIGFPQEEAESIFDKFQQAQHGDTLPDQPKGTGLGLAISREIVERHNGKIYAQSQPGKGSVFTLLLLPSTDSPTQTTVTAIVSGTVTLATAEDVRPSKPRLLVVDDDPGVRDYLTQLLQEQGYDVIAVADGQAAVIAAKAQRPNLITMDLAMPVMDGRTAITILRADSELQHIPIMVVSAISGRETAGGDLAMTKPLDESSFLKNIQLLLGGGETVELKKLRFLAIYDMERDMEAAPAGLTVSCEMDYCPLNELPARIQSGFQGMVLVPFNLLDKVDFHMLNAAPSLEVMIMPEGMTAYETRLEMTPKAPKQCTSATGEYDA